MEELKKYIEKYNVAEINFSIDALTDLYHTTYNLAVWPTINVQTNLEAIKKHFKKLEESIVSKSKPLDERIIKSFQNISKKYKIEIIDSKIEVSIPDFKVKYKHLFLEYENPKITIEPFASENQIFKLKVSKPVNKIISNLDSDQHPHCGSYFCFGTAKPFYQKLLSIYRYDIILDKLVLNVLTNLNEKDFAVPISEFFTKKELESKPLKVDRLKPCAKCGRNAIVDNAIEKNGLIYHQSCYARITKNKL